MLALFVLVAVLFIAEVFIKEAFSDMNTPGAMTWMAATGNQGFEDFSEPVPEFMPPAEVTMADGDINLTGGWTDPVMTEEQGFENDEEEEQGGASNFSLTDFLASFGSTGVEGMKGGRRRCYKNHWHNHRCHRNHRHDHSCNKQHGHNHRCHRQHGHGHMHYRGRKHHDIQGIVPAGPGQSLADQYKLANTPAAKQGKNFIKYQNGINPDDYIRKDSIPCYACKL